MLIVGAKWLFVSQRIAQKAPEGSKSDRIFDREGSAAPRRVCNWSYGVMGSFGRPSYFSPQITQINTDFSISYGVMEVLQTLWVAVFDVPIISK